MHRPRQRDVRCRPAPGQRRCRRARRAAPEPARTARQAARHGQRPRFPLIRRAGAGATTGWIVRYAGSSGVIGFDRDRSSARCSLRCVVRRRLPGRDHSLLRVFDGAAAGRRCASRGRRRAGSASATSTSASDPLYAAKTYADLATVAPTCRRSGRSSPPGPGAHPGRPDQWHAPVQFSVADHRRRRRRGRWSRPPHVRLGGHDGRDELDLRRARFSEPMVACTATR